MKARIGTAEFDFVSPAELRSILGEAAAVQRRLSPQTTRPEQGCTLDGTGAGTIELYRVPAGMEFALHRLTLLDDTHTFATLFTAAAGYANVQRHGSKPDDGVSFAQGSSNGGGIPCVKGWSVTDAPRYRNLEVIEIVIVGGPANAALIARAQGTLSPLTPA